jgi:glutamate-1-semialdehyde 2,1-aminomutase
MKLKKNLHNGFRYWKEAIKVIPGGNSILSKRPERYAGKKWPTYFSKSNGCKIWDLNGNLFIDMAQMGIGSSTLGYSNKYINNAVKKIIDKGISTTLNAPEEVELAKKLIKLNPGYKGVKFARSGGEAMAVAVRIARCFVKKQKIAFSGYHGWFDWYLATNLEDNKNLNEHLLEGLSPKGVYLGLVKSIFPFKYDDPKKFLQTIKKNKDIGIVIIESARYDYPKKEFVSQVNRVCREKNLILICDEITSGFRICNSGAYKIVGFKPDIIVYGKGLGNGFAISAIVGKSKIMKNSTDSFISSSNWSERVGFVAANKTLEYFEKNKVWKHLNKIGLMISKGWKKIFLELNLKITVSNFLPLVTMKLNYGELNNYILTYFIQDMLKKKYLVSASIYVSHAHTEKIILGYLKECKKTFEKISILLENNKIKNIINKKDLRSDAFTRL